MDMYRHKKRGTVYEVIDDQARLQCSSAPEFETRFSAGWTVYKSAVSGDLYIRPTAEFLDGRFEPVETVDRSDAMCHFANFKKKVT